MRDRVEVVEGDIIHTVGPVWRGGGHGEDALLASCYRRSLELAARHGIRTIAFPAISTGAYGFPLERATRIAMVETLGFLKENESIQKVLFICFGRAAYDTYTRTLQEHHLTLGQ